MAWGPDPEDALPLSAAVGVPRLEPRLAPRPVAGEPSAEAFAAAVQSRDEAAVAAAVGFHFPRLARYVSRLSGDPGLAEDIAQESLVRAVVACRRGRPPRQLATWLYAVATNLWRDAARSAERRHTTPGLPPDLAGCPDPAPCADDAEVLRAALGRLPPEFRAVLILHFYEGLTLGEIAHVTGAPLGTVKWRVFTALRRIRRLLDGEGRR